MRYPCLVPIKLCKTDIHIEIDKEEINEDGEPLEPVIVDTKCNYQDKAHGVFTAEKKLVKLAGKAYIPGDIVPELATISGGKVIVHGEERKLFTGTKARNPDGTVNYTLLEIE